MIAKSSAQFVDAVVQQMFAVRQGVLMPEPVHKLLTAHSFPWAFEQIRKNVDWMSTDLDLQAMSI